MLMFTAVRSWPILKGIVRDEIRKFPNIWIQLAKTWGEKTPLEPAFIQVSSRLISFRTVSSHVSEVKVISFSSHVISLAIGFSLLTSQKRLSPRSRLTLSYHIS